MVDWKDPKFTLGERIIKFMTNEMNNNVHEDSPGSKDSPRIREYFSVCTRTINGKEVPIGITKQNWCSSFISFALHESLLPGDKQPHGFRVGVVEVVSDLQKNNLWRPVELAKTKQFTPEVGDIVVTDRSNPNDPATAWYRHILAVYSVSNDSFQCISGNSGGKIRISNHTFNDKNLLGFGEYPSNRVSDFVVERQDFSNLIEDFYKEYHLHSD